MAQASSYGRVALVFALLIYFSFGLITSALAALVLPITGDLGLTLSQMGLILGSWQLVYIPAAYPMGLVVDRIGLRRALALGVAIIATSAFLRGLATSFEALLFAVSIFGLGGPIISTGIPKLATTLFTGRDRGLAIGAGLAGLNLGGFLALAATSSLVLPIVGSWENVFILYGGLACIILLLWLAKSRDFWFEGGKTKTDLDGKLSQFKAAKKIAKVKNVWLLITIGFVSFLSSHGLRMWLPYLLELKGMSPAEAGYMASIPMIVGIIGVLTLPRLSTQIGSERGMLMTVLIVSGVSIYIMGTSSGFPLWIALVAFGLTSPAILPLAMLIISHTSEVGSAYMGIAAGMYFSIGEVGGFGGPFLMGYLGDITGSFLPAIIALTSLNLLMLIPASLIREQE